MAAGTKPLHIKVELDITLNDPQDWTLAFGINGRREISRDVKEYVERLAQGGVFDNGEVSATVRLM